MNMGDTIIRKRSENIMTMDFIEILWSTQGLVCESWDDVPSMKTSSIDFIEQEPIQGATIALSPEGLENGNKS